LRTSFPEIKVMASEALQCPTLLLNGFGGHRIEGIGDKHVPWVHNVKNTDFVAAIDDEEKTVVFRRGKTGKHRSGVLWEITIEAIKDYIEKYPHTSYHYHNCNHKPIIEIDDMTELLWACRQLSRRRRQKKQPQAAEIVHFIPRFPLEKVLKLC